MSKRTHIAICFIIIFITFCTYFNSLQNEFIDYWDDNTYITGNELIKSLSFSNIKLIFSSTFSYEYYPISLLSYAIDYHFWKLNPMGFRITNVFLHSINAILIFSIILTITNKFSASFIAAIIFIIHPVNVESVAWLAERENVLSFLFFLLSLYLYIKSQETSKKLYYFASLNIYIFAILSKALPVTLPFILLLYDFCFTRKNLQEKILYKIPFLFISCITSIITVTTFKGIPTLGIYSESPYLKMLSMFRIFSTYVEKIFIPVRLNNFYVNYLSLSFFDYEIIISVLILSLITFFAYKSCKKEIVIFFCITWFFITLIPVSNVFPTCQWMADRYLYFPSFGFSLFIVILYEKILQRCKSFKNSGKLKIITVTFLIMLIAFYSTLTVRRNRIWKNSITLWEDCVKKDPNGALAHTYLGGAYMKRGFKDKAVVEFKRALQINPKRASVWANLAYIDINNGQLEEAFKKIRLALYFEADNYEAHNALGMYYMCKTKYNRAIVEFQRTLELQPESIIDFHLIYNNLGLAYQKEGQTQHAALAFNRASTFQ